MKFRPEQAGRIFYRNIILPGQFSQRRHPDSQKQIPLAVLSFSGFEKPLELPGIFFGCQFPKF
jgi:hypothetical protein